LLLSSTAELPRDTQLTASLWDLQNCSGALMLEACSDEKSGGGAFDENKRAPEAKYRENLMRDMAVDSNPGLI
jgi:hypothetical protein